MTTTDNLAPDVGRNSQPPRRSGNSTSPTVATGHQSVKRGGNRYTTRIRRARNREQATMGSKAERTQNLSSGQPGRRGLVACPKTGKGLRSRQSSNATPFSYSPGRLCGPNVAQNGCQERSNRHVALHGKWSMRGAGASRKPYAGGIA